MGKAFETFLQEWNKYRLYSNKSKPQNSAIFTYFSIVIMVMD